MLKLKDDEKLYNLATANSIKIKSSTHWKYKKQKVYVIQVKYAKYHVHLGLFPDKDEAEKFIRTIDYYSDKRITDEVIIPIPVYKDLYYYIEYKNEKIEALSYSNWRDFLKKKV